ncbi:MAG: hypothetical protein ACI9FB_001098 [Candidatus Azotimanducaceae bacterium]|jgi:hypothetical protein
MLYKACYVLILFITPLMAESAPYITEGFSRKLDFNITNDSNISKAWRSTDKLDDTLTSMSIGGAYSNPEGDSGLLIVNAYIGYQDHKILDDLDLFMVSFGGQYFFQFDSGYLAPTYQVGLDLRSLHYADSDARNGEIATFTLGVSKRLTSSTLTSVSYQHSRRNAESNTYETDNDFLNLGFEYRFTPKSTFYADVLLSYGDHLSSAVGANSIFSAKIGADAFIVDSVYGCSNQCEYSTYRFKGDGLSTTIGLVFSLAQNLNLDLSARLYDWEGDTGIGSNDWSANLGIVWQF